MKQYEITESNESLRFMAAAAMEYADRTFDFHTERGLASTRVLKLERVQRHNDGLILVVTLARSSPHYLATVEIPYREGTDAVAYGMI